jgi:transcriptional regulator
LPVTANGKRPAMYSPPHYTDDRPEILHAFIAQHPLGTLIASTPEEGLAADHIPMIWQPKAGTRHGVLHGHLARANPAGRTLTPDASVLVVFSGANHYVTPNWYASKQEGGRVVPTWNFAVVHARGTIRIHDDADRALEHLTQLTDRLEAGQPHPWKVTDAPDDFIASMIRGILPFEITLTALGGKFKSSQNRSAPDRDGVRTGLEALRLSAGDVAELVRDPLT